MNKFLIVAAVVLALSNSVCAKLHVSVSVEIPDENIKREIQEAVEARINSTERYTISSNALETDLILDVECLVLQNEAGYKNGVVCYSEVNYFPYKGSALVTIVDDAETMAVGGMNTSYVINYLMNHFINGTTDAVLADRKQTLQRAIRVHCSSEPTDCRMPNP
jgi:hypothetical protein